MNLTDASGTVVASYVYDEFGVPTSCSETLPTGWSNPSRYDGRDGVGNVVLRVERLLAHAGFRPACRLAALGAWSLMGRVCRSRET